MKVLLGVLLGLFLAGTLGAAGKVMTVVEWRQAIVKAVNQNAKRIDALESPRRVIRSAPS